MISVKPNLAASGHCAFTAVPARAAMAKRLEKTRVSCIVQEASRLDPLELALVWKVVLKVRVEDDLRRIYICTATQPMIEHDTDLSLASRGFTMKARPTCKMKHGNK